MCDKYVKCMYVALNKTKTVGSLLCTQGRVVYVRYLKWAKQWF